MKIFDILDESTSPCKECKYYGDGEAMDNGEEYHEFTCIGGVCLYCAEGSEFTCFKKKEK